MLYEYIESSKWLQERADEIHKIISESCDVSYSFQNGNPQLFINKVNRTISFVVTYTDPWDDFGDETYSYIITEDVVNSDNSNDVINWYNKCLDADEKQQKIDHLKNVLNDVRWDINTVEYLINKIKEQKISVESLGKGSVWFPLVDEVVKNVLEFGVFGDNNG